MATIDITTMRGEMPKIVPHLLPEPSSVTASNCHFRHGVITPALNDLSCDRVFTFKPETIFNYRADFWFAWKGIVDVIRSPMAKDLYNRIYYTDGTYPKVTSSQIATQGAGNYPAAHYRLGIPAPANPIAIGAITPPSDVGEDDPTDDDSRFYVETYVTAYGEEGPPGPVSLEVTIVHPGSSVSLIMEPPGAQNSNITRRRIYRSASGGGVADYLLLVELDIAVRNYTDVSLDKELGPTLETYDYFMPPEDMIGLCQMSNGICAGFAGNQVMFSEAYLPYAWPDNYKQTTADNIVAIAPIGTGLVVGTEGFPYIFSGITPSNISNAQIKVTLSCVSRRSMVAMDGYALYASPNGLVSVDGSGNAMVATENIIEAKQWRKIFKPETIRAWKVEGEYLALYEKENGAQGCFIFNPEALDIRHMVEQFDTAYIDPKTDKLYTVKDKSLYIFQGGTTPVALRWRSKPFLTPVGTSFSCLRIMSSSISRVGVGIYVDDKLQLTLPPGSITDELLRLPVLTGRRWQIEVTGYAQVDRITVSTSMQEMPA